MRRQAGSTLPSKPLRARRNWRMLRVNTILQFRFRTRPIFTVSTCHCAIPACEMRAKISECWLVAGICAGLFALVWFVFGQSIHFSFVNYDDPTYTYETPQVIA